MANIKCFSGGKCVKTFKNIDKDDIIISELSSSNYRGAEAIGHGLRITTEDKRFVLFDWRGDFLIEW
jgi:hypothetical protein